MREARFEGVVRADDIDVNDGFEGVGGELGDGGEEVSCGAGAGSCASQRSKGSVEECSWQGFLLHAEI